MPQARRASLLGRRAEVHLENNRSLWRSGGQRGGAVDVVSAAVAVRTGEAWFGSRSARLPAPSQAARQVRGDRRGRGRGAPAVIVPGDHRTRGGSSARPQESIRRTIAAGRAAQPSRFALAAIAIAD
jgi:hypothetical protein